jgi:hypothetical protein
MNVKKRKKVQSYDEFLEAYTKIQAICKDLYKLAENNKCEQQMDLIWLIRNIYDEDLKTYVKLLFGMTWQHNEQYFRLKLSTHSLSGFKISYRCGIYVDIDSSPEVVWQTNSNNYEAQFDVNEIKSEDDLNMSVHQNSIKLLSILNSVEQQTDSRIKNVHLFPIVE